MASALALHAELHGECVYWGVIMGCCLSLGVFLGCCLSRCWGRLVQVRTSDNATQTEVIKVVRAYWAEAMADVREEGLRRRVAGAGAMSRKELARVLLEQDLNEL